MTSTEIRTAVDTIREYTRIQEEASAIIEQARDAIKAHMDAAGLEDLAGTDYRITWHTVNGTTFDKKAAEEIHPGIIAACTRPNPSRRFILK
jgi:hypothetical protein